MFRRGHAVYFEGTLSQISRKWRTIQRASHVPSGFPHAFHSFWSGLVGLVRCVEMVKNVMIAIICTGSEQNKTIRYARVNSWTANYVPYLGGVHDQ
jgi:hypothetical protein